MAAVVAQITTPTVVKVGASRTGIVIYDNPNVTNNAHDSAYVIYADTTFSQEARSNLTTVDGAATGPGAFSDPAAPKGLGPGQ